MYMAYCLFIWVMPTLWALAFSNNYDHAKVVQKLVTKLELVKIKFEESDQGLRVSVNDSALYEANDPWITGVLLTYCDILDRELEDNNYPEKIKRLLIDETEDFWLERYLPIWENNYRRYRLGATKIKDQKASSYELGDAATESEREEIEGTTAWYLFLGTTIVLVLVSVVVATAVFVYIRRKSKNPNYFALISSSEDDEELVTSRLPTKSSRRQRSKTYKGDKETKKNFRY